MFSLLPYIGMIVTAVVCGLALWRGGPPERVGAGLVLVVFLIGQLIDFIFPVGGKVSHLGQVAHLGNDAFLAVGFLLVALRYGSLWLGGAMILQAVQFSLHAFYLVVDRTRDTLFAVVNNLNTSGIILCILAGALVAWRRRARREAVQPAPAAAPAI